MDISGEIDIGASVDNPEKYVTDAFVNIAMKDTVASMAGHGVDTTHVTGLEISFLPSIKNSAGGRRLVSVSGHLLVKYVITVPESISDAVTSSLQAPSRDVRDTLQLKLAMIGEGSELTVNSATMSSPKFAINAQNVVAAGEGQQNVLLITSTTHTLTTTTHVTSTVSSTGQENFKFLDRSTTTLRISSPPVAMAVAQSLPLGALHLWCLIFTAQWLLQ